MPLEVCYILINALCNAMDVTLLPDRNDILIVNNDETTGEMLRFSEVEESLCPKHNGKGIIDAYNALKQQAKEDGNLERYRWLASLTKKYPLEEEGGWLE